MVPVAFFECALAQLVLRSAICAQTVALGRSCPLLALPMSASASWHGLWPGWRAGFWNAANGHANGASTACDQPTSGSDIKRVVVQILVVQLAR